MCSGRRPLDITMPTGSSSAGRDGLFSFMALISEGKRYVRELRRQQDNRFMAHPVPDARETNRPVATGENGSPGTAGPDDGSAGGTHRAQCAARHGECQWMH